MKCREHQVSGQSCIYDRLGSFWRSRLSHQNHIRIMSQTCFESIEKVISFAIIDLRLLNTVHMVFDWIFERDDFPFAVIFLVQQGVQSGRFS